MKPAIVACGANEVLRRRYTPYAWEAIEDKEAPRHRTSSVVCFFWGSKTMNMVLQRGDQSTYGVSLGDELKDMVVRGSLGRIGEVVH